MLPAYGFDGFTQDCIGAMARLDSGLQYTKLSYLGVLTLSLSEQDLGLESLAASSLVEMWVRHMGCM